MMIQLTLNVLLQAAAVTAGGHDYATAYQQAVDKNQPLVILVGADWCPGCQTMKNSSIPELQRTGGLNTVAFAQVNTDRESALAGKLMRGGSIPQLVMFYKTEDGWKRDQLTGAYSAGDIKAFLQKPDRARMADASPPIAEVSAR
jgi:thioredoxin-like negative regulator of GroEL